MWRCMRISLVAAADAKLQPQSKYVKGNPKFLDLVSNWQRKLGTVDTVLTLWRDVCRKWQALESIFVGSEDIRVQLPEDSRRFDGVNVDFQDLQRLAPVRGCMLYIPALRCR